jgi:Phosphotransferase enzyme family
VRHGADIDEIRAVAAASAGPADPHRMACEQIFDDATASATVGIWRFADDGWSAILKVLRHRAGRSPRWQSGEEEDHWFYWRREALAYSSGLLARLTAPLRAPRCYGVFDRSDGSVGLWLEDLRHAAPAGAWPLDRYRSAAFALGTAQGRLTASGDLPTDRWLARHWLRRYVERRQDFVSHLDDRDAPRLPLVAHHLRPELGEEARSIWDDRERLLAIVEAAPQTLCHLDLHPGNLFADDGETVLIDWAFVGLGALGEDAGNLIFDALFDFFVPAERIAVLAEAVSGGYLGGLEASGWQGDTGAVLRALHAAAAVKYFWILPAMLEAAAGGKATLNGAPIEECFTQWAPVVSELVAFARRA